mgnify:CR=1 FL=1
MSQADRPPSAVQPADVLRLWLGAHPLERAAMQRVQAQWFRKDEAFDAGLRQHFLPTIEAARDGRLDDWTQSAEGRLALIIVLDQFTRNVFRGQPASFAADAQALAARDGELAVEPQRNGPLEVTGNLEVVSGTGHTIDRVSETWLCRCGHSQNKPFCDGSHLKFGFEADGA